MKNKMNLLLTIFSITTIVIVIFASNFFIQGSNQVFFTHENKKWENIISFTSFESTSEGQVFQAIFDTNNELQNLIVRTFGSVWQIKEQYTFIDDFVVHSLVSINYPESLSEPNTQNIPDSYWNIQTFIIKNDEVYLYFDSNPIVILDKDMKTEILNRFQFYINTLTGVTKGIIT